MTQIGRLIDAIQNREKPVESFRVPAHGNTGNTNRRGIKHTPETIEKIRKNRFARTR